MILRNEEHTDEHVVKTVFPGPVRTVDVSSHAVTDTARGAVDELKDTMSDALDRGQATLAQAGDAISKMAETTAQQVTTFASELQATAKRNPLGTMAGAVVIGVLIGLLARGRA
jgi:ElaB/YqjD/DUF883 family membrane-anchored ribosome-binding protein